MERVAAVLMKNITKTFGSTIANDKVSLEIKRGEILSLLGENGSGKTTLMNMLSGIYFPDEGQIFIDGEERVIRSPKDAFDNGIGMIHQHFKLVDVFTAAENLVLGVGGSIKLDLAAAAAEIKNICDKYGFSMDPNQRVYDMSVSQKQTLEIIKVLYRGVDVLILDEPTAVLTPQETQKLFAVMRNMKADGKAVVIITHKLHEVMDVSDRVAVLRKGTYVGEIATCDTNPQELTNMMVGHAVSLNIERPTPQNTVERLRVSNLSYVNSDGIKVLDNVSFSAFGGEILGIAGISGCGQKELLEGIAGLVPVTGSVKYRHGDSEEYEEILGKSPTEISNEGVLLSLVPEDRLGMGLVGTMDITDNMMLKTYKSGKSIFTNRRSPKKLAEEIVEQLEVVTPNISTPVSKLSGGNVQKILVGREISSNPTVLMTAYAVRGLDINTSYTIYHLLNEQKKKGVAVIYVGEDLDVLLELCDKIMVLCSGKMNGIVDGNTTTKEEVGLLMTNLREEEKGE